MSANFAVALPYEQSHVTLVCAQHQVLEDFVALKPMMKCGKGDGRGEQESKLQFIKYGGKKRAWDEKCT